MLRLVLQCHKTPISTCTIADVATIFANLMGLRIRAFLQGGMCPHALKGRADKDGTEFLGAKVLRYSY